MQRLTPATLAQAYRDPVSWLILAVDLFPVIAIFQLGWGAAALVMLYWLENLVIGFITLLRMIASTVRHGVPAIFGAFALGAFFTVHYGMFCFVHGVFLMAFAEISADGSGAIGFSPSGLLNYALTTGTAMVWFVGAILLLQLFLFARDFIFGGEYRETDPMSEMARPYGRIVVLHIALFAGFGLLAFLGEPFVGILALILLRAAWGVVQSVQRQQEIAPFANHKVDEASPI